MMQEKESLCALQRDSFVWRSTTVHPGQLKPEARQEAPAEPPDSLGAGLDNVLSWPSRQLHLFDVQSMHAACLLPSGCAPLRARRPEGSSAPESRPVDLERPASGSHSGGV
jgi:hypothetical protein